RFASICLHGLELVAGAANGQKPFRVRGVTLDLVPDVGHVQVGSPLVAYVIRIPEVTHDLAARVDPPGSAGKQPEELQLEAGQLDAPAVHGGLVFHEVDDEVADGKLRAATGSVELAPAQQRTNTRDDLRH